MKFLFIADPLEKFQPSKDSSIAMMREAASRGHQLWACESKHLLWQRRGSVCAKVREVSLTGQGQTWFEPKPWSPEPIPLHSFDVVLMRQDPPFDSEYFYATHLLQQAQHEGATIFNSPAALRNYPEKLAIMAFSEFIGPTLVTKDPTEVQRFHHEHQDIILKPLDGMGGKGIFRVGPDGLNLGSITETLNHQGQTTMMVQRYLPEISEGDKRILLIAGEPVPYCLARVPQGNEIRGNLAVGGKGIAQPLTARDFEIAQGIGPVLHARGLLLVGLDVIGDCLTEINVTSPTCFQEITDQTGFKVASLFIDAVEAACKNKIHQNES